ncbi:hypothetical protein RKD26_006515 [Streptomyces calvus]
MAAVDHLQAPGLRAAGDHGGDEVVVAEVAGQAALDAADDVQEVRFVVGGLPEDAEHQRGRAHGRQSLAADVTDDHADPVRGGDERVEVAADAGLGRRGAVVDGHPERADGLRHRLEQGVLRGLRDGAHGGQHPLAASAQRAGERAGRGDRHQRGEHDRQLRGGHAVPDADSRAEERGQQSDAEDAERAAGGRGERRSGREQRQPDLPGSAEEVDEHDGEDDHQGQGGRSCRAVCDGPYAGCRRMAHPPLVLSKRPMVATMLTGLTHVSSAVLHLYAAYACPEMSAYSGKVIVLKLTRVRFSDSERRPSAHPASDRERNGPAGLR